MDNEKLQRANELVEAIKEIEEFLKAFPNDSKEISKCQIRVLYNFSPRTEKIATIVADRIPAAFQNLRASAMVQLTQYKKEFEKL